MRRLISFVLTCVLLITWLIPSTTPSSRAAAQTLENGMSLSGDFKGAGYQQVASLYDPHDDLGLRIVVLDPTPDGKMTSSQWFIGGPNSFDLARMKVGAVDLNGDRRTDLAVLYNDFNLTVHIVVFLSTGTSFAYQGNEGWFRHTNFDWNRAQGLIGGVFDGAPRSGLMIPYALPDYRLKILYLVATGGGLQYTGDWGSYDSGPGQLDVARARFMGGHFTRSDGVDQIAMVYQYPNYQIGVHVFDPSPVGLRPIGGWAGRWISPVGFFDTSKAKLTVGDVDKDGLSDIVVHYFYADGSSRLHFMLASRSFALTDVSGVVAPPIYYVPWPATQTLAADLDGDGWSDVVTLSDDNYGATHAARLKSNGTTLTPTYDAWVTPADERQPVACVNCWPLNGAPVAPGYPSPLRRPLAVKIDNAPAARPHYGISQADMVMELLVEGYITRLAAYFHSLDPWAIGAIRSVRFSDRYTTPMVRGSLVFSGASQLMESLVRADIANGYYVGVSPQLGQGYAFYRADYDGRVSPHNLFSSSQRLRDATNDVGGGGAVSVPGWDFLPSAAHYPTLGGFVAAMPATSLLIPYRADARVIYNYDAATRTYARYQSLNSSLDYRREIDGMNGVAIAARNVVVINTDIWVTGVIDDAGGAPSLDMRLTGSGRASIFRDGLRQEAYWYRATNFDPFTFTTTWGAKIYLSPGQTWIHIVPTDWQIPSS